MANVTISLSSTDPSEGTLSSSSLTFTPRAIGTSPKTSPSQAWTTTSSNGDQTYQINGTASSADANYNGLAMPNLTVVNTEADVAGLSVAPAALTTSETGTSASFNVALTSAPSPR